MRVLVIGQVLAESNKILNHYLELIFYSIQFCSLFPYFKMSFRHLIVLKPL